MTLTELLASMRADGWMVAAHNDYAMDNQKYTFWLFTHAKTGRFVKGEAATDERAVSDAWTMSKIILGLEVIPAESHDGHPPPDHTASAGKPIYPLREGATALLVPFAEQPSAEFSEAGPAYWYTPIWSDDDGEEYPADDDVFGVADADEGYESPVEPGETISTTLGERRVVAVRAVDTDGLTVNDYIRLACKNGRDMDELWDDWDREHPGVRWAWLVSVEPA